MSDADENPDEIGTKLDEILKALKEIKGKLRLTLESLMKGNTGLMLVLVLHTFLHLWFYIKFYIFIL